MRKIVVIGGGASGIMAAITAAKEGAHVTIVEQKDRIGKKLLSTGNGRCNLTNEFMDITCFRGENLSIVSDVLNQFGVEMTKSFFEGLGVILKSRQGYLYPISDQASTILDVLRMEIERLGIEVLLSQKVVEVSKKKSEFVVKTTQSSLSADAVILSTGGKASSVLGSDGSGYALAKTFGHKLTAIVPALVQLIAKGKEFKAVSGVRTHASVSLFLDGEHIASDTGELQLTDYGISGIPVFQISRYAAKGLYEKKRVVVSVDLLPTFTKEELEEFFKTRIHVHGSKNAEDFFVGMFHKKLIGILLKRANISYGTTMNTISYETQQLLLTLCKNFEVEILDTKGFEHAQVCAGGVKTTEIHPETMESLFENGLYLTGELLDVDGICGGYNLQWAWATGYIAGKNAAKGN